MSQNVKVDFSLTPDQAQFVESQVASGKYSSIEDVLLAALSLLRKRESDREIARQQLTDMINEGLDAARQGHFCTEEELLAEIEELSSKRRAAAG